MAQVPLYQQRNVSITGGMPRETTDLSGLVRGMGVAADAWAKYEERKRATDESFRRVEIDAAYREVRAGYSTLKGAQAAGITKDYAEQRSRLTSGFSEAAADDPITKSNLEVYTAEKYEREAEWVLRYQLQEDAESRKQADIATRDSVDKDLNETPTEGLLPGMEEGVKKATEGFIAREDPSGQRAYNYHSAATDDIYANHITQRFLEDPSGAVKFWDANKGVIEKKVSSEVFNDLQSKYNQAKPRAAYNDTITFLDSTFGDDNVSKYNYVDSTDMEKKHGLEGGAKWALQRELAGKINYNYQQSMRFEQEQADSEAGAVEKLLAKGDLDGAQALLREAKWIKPESRNAWGNQIANMRTRPEPKEVMKLYRDIASGKVTTHAEISSYIGQGVGLDMSRFHSLLDRLRADNAKGLHTNRVHSLRRKYDKLSKHEDPKQRVDISLIEEFIELLWIDIGKKGYTAVDPRVFKIGVDLMNMDYWKIGEKVQKEKPIRAMDYIGPILTTVLEPAKPAARFEKRLDEVYDPKNPTGPSELPPPEVITEGEVKLKEKDLQQPPPRSGTVTAPPSKTGADNVDEQLIAMTLQEFEADPWSIPGDTVEEKIDNFFLTFPGREATDEAQMIVRNLIESARPVE